MAPHSEEVVRGLRPDARYPWRNENLGRLLLQAVRSWQDALVGGLRREGFTAFTTTHMNLLRHIDLDGTRITEIADRAGTTKQAVGQLITACTALGLLATRPDPADKRAKIVAYTDLGRDLILAQLDIMKQIDALLDARLGRDNHAKLRELLLAFPLDLQPAIVASVPAARPKRRTKSS